VKNVNLKAFKHVSVEMKIVIFLFITTQLASQRDMIEKYSVGSLVLKREKLRKGAGKGHFLLECPIVRILLLF
jgi:hypothetical protein